MDSVPEQPPSGNAAAPPAVPWERVTRFARLLFHDVRNSLSAIELAAASLAEIHAQAPAQTQARQALEALRAAVAESVQKLRRLSDLFSPAPPQPLSWSAAALMEELRRRWREGTLLGSPPFQAPPLARVRIESAFEPAPAAQTPAVQTAAPAVRVDLEQTLAGVAALLRNALYFEPGAPVRIVGRRDAGDAQCMALEIRARPAASPADTGENPSAWGREPLVSTRPGGYGLELFALRRLLQIQGGRLVCERAGAEVVVRLLLPFLRP